ncbi:hypothetical protein B0H14DRAFT_2661703 [Mycena olivaceomarginata]|nr:hypothetical protein B0H14DRAFT_2661703 [Mycena olivaceomarginata]
MSAETRNLSDGSAQALQALLHSLTPDAPPGAGGKLSTAAVEKLSARLSELVGDGSGEPQRRIESGQLLNEEGLPIIDITEPVVASEAHVSSEFLNEDVPVPLAALPTSEQERRRRDRDRILDLLEEEEEREQRREEREEISDEKRQEILRKRKKAAQDELARLKAAKDMQRKMGKALLRDISTSRDEPAPSVPSPDSAVQEDQETALNPRKTVTFADAALEADASESRETEASEWGDVVPARLRANSGRSLMSDAKSDSTPMKMNVVERIPGKPVGPQGDSDDESEPPDSPTVADSDEEGRFESDEELAEEVDMDFARHQREIALEYNSKRARMAETTSNTLRPHFHDHHEDKTGEQLLDQSSRKPAISHFQANRLASSYNAAAPPSSKSLSANVVPSDTAAHTFQRAIRMGKLDSDNRLVGPEAGESGSDEEDYAAMQEITELLKKGEVYNLGPDGNYLHTVPPNLPATSPPVVQPSVATPDGPPPSSRKPSASKFKLARSGRPPAATPLSPGASRSSTPTSNVGRSSPKLPPPSAEDPSSTPSSSKPAVLSTVVEKPPSAASTAFTSVIMDSPSFPESRRPQHPPVIVRAADKPAKVSRFLAERM